MQILSCILLSSISSHENHLWVFPWQNAIFINIICSERWRAGHDGQLMLRLFTLLWMPNIFQILSTFQFWYLSPNGIFMGVRLIWLMLLSAIVRSFISHAYFFCVDARFMLHIGSRCCPVFLGLLLAHVYLINHWDLSYVKTCTDCSDYWV